MMPKFSTQKGLPQQARAVAGRLKLHSPLYDSTAGAWPSQEHALWWQVVEETVVDTSYVDHPTAKRRNHAEEAIEWFRTEGAAGILGILGFSPRYVREKVHKWLEIAYPEEVK